MSITKDTSVSELYHHGIKGMRWGVRRFQNEDGTLTQEGRSRLRGYDDDFEDSENFGPHFLRAREYSDSWERKYGSAPINRLRFEYNLDTDIRRGRDYCSDYDWNQTSMDQIYDSYRDYRESEEWD